MTKTEFIDHIKPLLKQLGFRKNGCYWHRDAGQIIQCIFVQGSQWDAENYYVEVGWAHWGMKKPTLGHWLSRGRLPGGNPPPNALLEFLAGPASAVGSLPQMHQYLAGTRYQMVLGVFEFDPK